jgi:Lrp/AsnC family leucine-responsive transcriptional regulator
MHASHNACQKREAVENDLSGTLRRMEEACSIKGCRAILYRSNREESILLFVNYTLSDTKSCTLASFNKALHVIPEIEECYIIVSGYN